MASSSNPTASSSSSSSPQWKHSVFLNFRGEDTRKGFVSHLYKALVQHGIQTFKDDEELEKGNEFPPRLMEAIEGSKIFVVVISQDYASSSWCLNELVKIMECRDTMGLGQTVIPVFYKVDPSHVRKQEGTFATAFVKHGKSSKEKMWRDALTKVATISGWDSRQSNDDATLVERLVREISDILWNTSSSGMDGLVGIDKHLDEMSSLLSLGSNDVRMVGIWGMGGVGKTTLARAVYDRAQLYMGDGSFQGKCFLPDVKESFRRDGAAAVIEKLLSQIFMERNPSVRVTDGGSNIIKQRLRNIKSIIVLDDVNRKDQLEILAGRCDWFGLGSRIIITTRYKHLLTSHRVEHMYKVNCLEYKHSLQLFNQNAFRGNPIPNEYSELCERVMFYAKGLPLALKVLGSSLCGKSKPEWESELKKLESILDPGVHDVLKLSYDDLDVEQKTIFLDIACFFNGLSKTEVQQFVEFISDIDALTKKSLLTSREDGSLEMHHLLQQMGRKIVRQESNNPGKRSRLWIPSDIKRVLTNNTGSEKVEGILLNLSKSRSMSLGASTFAAMCNLRFLKFYVPEFASLCQDLRECKVNLPNGLESLPDELRYLYWYRYPLTSLPHDFIPDNLAVLSLPDSSIEQLPRDIYKLKSLREINLSGCGNLRSFLEISEPMECLHTLRLDGTGIKELHPSIENLTGLRSLVMNRCKNLEHLPSSIWSLQSLENLSLSYCPNLKGLPTPIISNKLKFLRIIDFSGCGNLRSFPAISVPMNCLSYLRLDGTRIKELHPSIENLTGLRELSLKHCKSLERLPSSIWCLESLKTLVLIGCPNLKGLPTPIISSKLKSLDEIWLNRCVNLRSFPEISEPMDCMSYLGGAGIKELHPSIGNLTGVRFLNMENCKDLERLPSSIWSLKSLRTLRLSDCPNLRALPPIPTSGNSSSVPVDDQTPHQFSSLETLELRGTGIKELHKSFGNLSGLRFLDMENCKNLERLPSSIWSLKSLEELRLSDCPNLRALPPRPPGIKELHPSIEHLTGLGYLELQNCKNLERLPSCIWSLKSLRELRLSDCPNLRALPPIPTSGNSSSVPVDDQTPHQFSSLQNLDIRRNNFESLPENLKELSSLKVLELSGCRKLKSLPELPRSLTSMIAEDCISLETVSTSWHSFSPFGDSHFSYVGCFKLSRKAQSNIVENFLRHTQYTPPVHYDDGEDDIPQEYNSWTGLRVNIPGSEIPEFFRYQSKGSFLTADLPRDWNNSDFMGFAVCAVFEFIGFDSKEDTSKDVNSMNSEEDTSKDVDRMNSDDDNSRNIGNFLVYCDFSLSIHYSFPSSDHIVMGYDAKLATKIGGDEQLKSSNFSFKFTIGSGLRVKKCGVGLIYKNAQGRKRKRD